MRKKGIVWGRLVEIIIFAVALVVTLQLCSTVYNTFYGPKDEGPRDTLAQVQQAINHLDPDFNELSRVISVNTEDYQILGFDKDSSFPCPDDKESCICLCQKENCDDLTSGKELVRNCKIISYRINYNFIISSDNEYRSFRVILVKSSEDDEYRVAVENG